MATSLYYVQVFVLILALTKKVYCQEKNTVKDIRSTLALEILQSTIKSAKNTAVAILPLQFLFCKIASVARGRAKEELLKALQFSNAARVNSFYSEFKELMQLPQQYDLTYVNKIYLDYSKNIDLKFAENSSALYGVHVDKVSYNLPRAAMNFINRGISTTTYRRVENILEPGDINNLTSLLLITAGHFKPSWEKRFDSRLTVMRTFRYLNNTRVDIPMMIKSDYLQFYDTKDFRIITKRLGSWGCSMTFIQPDFLSLDTVLDKLVSNPNTMKEIREKMTWQYIKFVLPRMKVKSQIDLDSFLLASGVKEIFNSKSTDLNAILKEGSNPSNVHVSKVRQKFFIEVDEFGVSRVEDEYARLQLRDPPNTLEVALNKPFYFTVNFELSPTELHELFNGVYYGPE